MNKKAWKIWCTALKTTFTTDRTYLHSPLGDWSEKNPPSQKWLTHKDKEESLFIAPLQQRETWTEHKLIGINKSQGLIYDTKGLPATPPKKAVKITLRLQTKHTYIFNDSTAAAVLIRHPKEKHPNDNAEAIKRATGPSCHLQGDLEDIASALQDGTLQGAADGSVKDKKGTSEWIIEPTHITRSETNMSGAGPVDGDPEYLNLTQVERSGFLGPIFAVYQIAK